MCPRGSWPGNQRRVLDWKSYLGAWPKCRLYLGRSGWGLRFRISAKPQARSAARKNTGSMAGQGQQVERKPSQGRRRGDSSTLWAGPGPRTVCALPKSTAGPADCVYSVTQPMGHGDLLERTSSKIT